MKIHTNPARFTRSLVPVVSATLLSALIVLQSFTLIFGPIMPNAAAATIPNFNIAVVGDWGCTADTTSTVNKIKGKSPELSISLADNSYATTADCWFSKVSPIDSQLHTAIGNHDVMSTTLLAQYMNHYKMQNQYYSFKYQNIHFLVLSTETDYAVGTAQYNFAKADLQKAASDPSVQWIIVSFHRLMYGSPNDHNVTSATSLRKVYHPLFQQYGVDVVLDGHMHSYERSYPLKFNSANPASPIIESTSTSTYNDPVGQIFATVGTGGFSHHTFTSKGAAFATQANGVFGFLNIDMLNNGQTLTASFYSNGGTTKDKFTIQKSQSSSSPTSTVSTNINNPSVLQISSSQNNNGTSDTATTAGQEVYLSPQSSSTNINNPSFIAIASPTTQTANGGGGNNTPPTANAGPAQTVHDGDLVTLDGSGSRDTDGGGTIASYAWKQTAGPPMELSDSTAAQPTFIPPKLPQDAILTFSLVVTDNNGATSAPATVNILLKDPPADLPPQANAGLDRAVSRGALVTLDASKSSDADGKIEYYQWTQTAGPLVQLMEPDDMGGSMSGIKTTFKAPNAASTLQFRLTVFDAEAGKTGRDTVVVTLQ